MAIPMLKIRRPLGRLIFNMGIAIPGKTVFLIETAPRELLSCLVIQISISIDNIMKLYPTCSNSKEYATIVFRFVD